MTTTLINHAAILSVVIPFLLILLHSCVAFSTIIHAEDSEDYVVDAQFLHLNARYQPKKIKKGAHCDPITHNICKSVSVNNGTGLLQCCKTHCRNVLGDRNNCGSCRHKCGFGELCCNGICTDVSYNADHCGKCHNKCSPGVKCEYGTCGYA